MLLKFFLNFFLAHKVCLLQYIDFLWFLVWQNFDGNFENEALENEDRSTKHPKLETCLSFKNTSQSLVKSPAAGIKHDNK